MKIMLKKNSFSLFSTSTHCCWCMMTKKMRKRGRIRVFSLEYLAITVSEWLSMPFYSFFLPPPPSYSIILIFFIIVVVFLLSVSLCASVSWTIFKTESEDFFFFLEWGWKFSSVLFSSLLNKRKKKVKRQNCF